MYASCFGDGYSTRWTVASCVHKSVGDLRVGLPAIAGVPEAKGPVGLQDGMRLSTNSGGFIYGSQSFVSTVVAVRW